MNLWNSQIERSKSHAVKLINKGIFYGVKIEFYKIFFDQKYHKSKKKVILLSMLSLLLKLRNKQAELIFDIINGNLGTCSQLGQDLFVLQELDKKKYGFFIEIGAGDGKTFSNSFLLEKEFKWNGVLIEPSKTFYENCKKIRQCQVVNKLLLSASRSSEKFFEMENGEFSFSEGYKPSHAEKIRAVYEVEITSFDDLFQDYQDIPKIDFISVDTEGSELDIIKSIDFERYKPTIVCIEHNFRKFDRKFLKKFFKVRGYKLKYEGISRWDSWFVLKS